MILLLAAACSSSDPLACGPIADLDPLLASPGTILVGELHGTAETPAFAGDVVCHALKLRPTVLALEVADSEQALLDQVLASGDRAALLRGPFWSRADQDGRSSAAMADLVLRAHAFQAAGQPISIVAFDRAAPSTDLAPGARGPRGPDLGQRDRSMADALTAALAAHPGATLVALTGNLHGRRTLGLPWDPGYVTMGSVLADRGPVTAVLVRASNGSAWNCQADGCTSRSFGDAAAQAIPPKVVKVSPPADGYDATVDVGRFTASGPAASAPAAP